MSTCHLYVLSTLPFCMKLLFYDDELMTSIYLKKNAVDILQSERRIKKHAIMTRVVPK